MEKNEYWKERAVNCLVRAQKDLEEANKYMSRAASDKRFVIMDKVLVEPKKEEKAEVKDGIQAETKRN